MARMQGKEGEQRRRRRDETEDYGTRRPTCSHLACCEDERRECHDQKQPADEVKTVVLGRMALPDGERAQNEAHQQER